MNLKNRYRRPDDDFAKRIAFLEDLTPVIARV
jgi:hypothetical protein